MQKAESEAKSAAAERKKAEQEASAA